jgi:hypothetical protein
LAPPWTIRSEWAVGLGDLDTGALEDPEARFGKGEIKTATTMVLVQPRLVTGFPTHRDNPLGSIATVEAPLGASADLSVIGVKRDRDRSSSRP